MEKKSVLISIGVTFLILSSSVLAEQRHVPSEYPTIQDAIDAANNGDTVIVAKGTYTGPGNRNIDFLGKAITVQSINPNDSNIVSATIIDCQGVDNELRRGFYFHNGEETDSVLSGLTITNGYSDGSWPANNGGAIYCTASKPTIKYCRMINNRAEHHGGAIYFRNSSPEVHGCTISDNFVDTWFGGGVYCIGGRPIFNSCMINDNVAVQGGGGIYSRENNVSISYCNIKSNHCRWSGGGIYFFQCDDAKLNNCMITNNTSSIGAAAILMSQGHHKIDHCTVTKNNGSPSMGSIYGGTGTITNSIVWDNAGWWQIRGGLNVSFCNVGGAGYSGEGNINADPLFVSSSTGNYHLLPTSPCINTGDPCYVAELNETDLDGNPRMMGGRVDIGAYEYSYVEASMKFTPQALNLSSGGKLLKAHFTLPEGFSVEDVDVNTPAVIEPFGVESYDIKVILDDEGLVRVEATFRRSDLCSSITSYDENIEVMVTGRLNSGQYFYGTDIIKVTDRALEALGVLVSHWLQEDCSKPDWCGGTDINQDSVVNFLDFALLDRCCIEEVTE